ncbi:DEAD/DEAH box helicase [Spongorhabdus nitratireducens]
MSEANPLALARNLDNTLKRYIATAVPIHSRYPQLRQAFWDTLQSEQLVKGPYIETVPDFEKGRPLRDLIQSNGGFLHEGFSDFEPQILDRKLHLHQEVALTNACHDGQNLVVATGTGSGKTETFLYPLVDMLLKDENFDQPGVRAILVYPMNALANDQLYYRVAPLLGKTLRKYGITFGRYTGQTPKGKRRDEVVSEMLENSKIDDEFGFDGIPDNWLLTREEMLANPPKVLVTNYAMLEHLLLLPANRSLFSHTALKAMVLDEVHTYNGAQATEVAMLLRKLKNRLKIDYPLQFFATSASLGDSPESDQKLKTFSASLFGEKEPVIVRGNREAHAEITSGKDAGFSLSADEWIKTGQAISSFLNQFPDSKEQSYWDFSDALEQADLSAEPFEEADNDNEPLCESLFRVFATNREISLAAETLQQGVTDFVELSHTLFPESSKDQAVAALTGLIQMGMYARSPVNGFPLLPCRHHIMAGAIEELSILPSDSPEGYADIKLARRHQSESNIYYPLLTCRQCGQPYFEGYHDNGSLVNHHPGKRATRRVFWLGKPPSTITYDEDDAQEAISQAKVKPVYLNTHTGQLGTGSDQGIEIYEVSTVDDSEEQISYLKRCAACHATASGAHAEIITRFYPGNESLSSVVTQRVIEALPKKTGHDDDRPMAGRKLLTFSDNRQDAAFFAPYFERTAGDLAHRAAIIKVLEEASKPLPFDTVAEKVRAIWSKEDSFAYPDREGYVRTDFDAVSSLLTGKIVAEFCTPPGRRLSTEALGLAKVTYDERTITRVVDRLHNAYKHLASQQDIYQLTHLFLENIRRNKAITNIPYDPDIKDGIIWGENYKGKRSFELEKTDSNSSVFGWLTKAENRFNRRTWYLVKQLNWSLDDANSFLADLWDLLSRSRLITASGSGKALDSRSVLLVAASPQDQFECKGCGLKQFHVVNHRCTAFGCTGEVTPCTLSEEEILRNHYIYSATKTSPLVPRAREHTASLSTDLREKIESDFHQSKVNILSCTTTMEVGVDLGELEAVVNLNVPPGIASYQQRTGRAGRRAQAAPFCVTIARNSYYDRVVFNDFAGYLSKAPADPMVHLANPTIFQRHQLSILLSDFLSDNIQLEKLRAPVLADLFDEEMPENYHLEFRKKVQAWLEGPCGQQALGNARYMLNLLPDEESAELTKQVTDISRLFVDELERFSAQISDRWLRYTDYMEKAKAKLNDGDNKASGEFSRWDGQREAFMGQYLVNQLSQKGLIPTYSFPVHSISLEVTKERKSHKYEQVQSEIAMTRDASMGISEYAPGGEVIANGKIWRSAGLSYTPRDFMPTEYVLVCRSCSHANVADDPADIPNECENCRQPVKDKSMPFIKPKGFITALKESKGKDPSSVRKRPTAADEAKLIVIPREDAYTETGHALVKKVLMPSQAEDELEGRLFILNRGRAQKGYYRCPYCNYMELVETPRPPKNHSNPETNQPCKGRISSPVALAHEFWTDVLIFKIGQNIASTVDMPADDSADHIGNVAVTLSEAFRRAIIEMLDIPPSEVRSTYRIERNSLSVIIYDGVPGGAGYVRKVCDQIAFNDLSEHVLNSLQCPKECSDACISCLCDYSNQRFWDAFNRHAAIEYMEQLTADTVLHHPVEKLGAVVDSTASVASLSESWSKYNELLFVLPGLAEDSDDILHDIKWLLDLLNQGKKVSLLLTEPLPDKFNKTSSGLRSLMHYLIAYIRDGQLNIAYSEALNKRDPAFEPFAIGNPESNSTFWFTMSPFKALNALAVNDTVLSMGESEFVQSDFYQSEVASHRYEADYFLKRQPVLIHKFSVGETRKTRSIFSELEGSYIEKLYIRDPYAATDNSIRPLEKLISELTDMAQTINELRVDCRLIDRDDNHQTYESKLKSLLAPYASKVYINVYPFHRKKSFHDRRVVATVFDDSGATSKYFYELSGGVSHLMNSECETMITCYKPDEYGA